MNVGLVLCFPNAVSVLSRKQVLWEAWRQQTAAVTAGPISASKFSTVHVAFQVDPLAQPGTVTLYERYRPLDGSFPDEVICTGGHSQCSVKRVGVSSSEAVRMCPRSSPCRMLPQYREPSICGTQCEDLCDWSKLEKRPIRSDGSSRCRSAKRLGISCWTRSMKWRMHLQLGSVR